MVKKTGKWNDECVNLSEIECFVLDMDGTINLEWDLIDGALDFISILKERGTDFYFFTNNSSKSPVDYVRKLERLGFEGMTRKNVMTSGDVMVHYLKTHTDHQPRIYLAGTPELEKQFREEGIILENENVKACDIDFVVQGFDTTYEYRKMDAVCRLAYEGVPFLATNIDRVCPMKDGRFIPDCGSMCKMVTHATGVEPRFVGKPFRETVDFILDKTGSDPKKTAMVGDRLYTDIKTAVNGGICGICVLSGEVTYEEILEGDVKPDYVLNSVKEIYEAIKEGR